MSDERDDKNPSADEGEPLGLLAEDAWTAQSPPSDFAERVLARVRAETKGTSAPAAADASRTSTAAKKRTRRWGIVSAGIVATAIAAAIFLQVTSPPSKGEAIAQDRIEVAIGGRARAVLEPGAQVKWNGDDVEQNAGDVFYRVEPGARFRVHTPAGDVEVKGTCFVVKVKEMQKRDLKSGAVGAALSALAFVAVYEGKVAVSHASQRADLAAGESAQIGADGVTKSAAVGEGQKAFDDKVAQAEPLGAANENLVSQVSEYKKRLEAIATQKAELEKKLKTSEERLAAAQADGAVPQSKPEFDIGPDEWKELAKDGTMKMQIPCVRPGGWSPKPENLQALGLAPQDGPMLKNAYLHSNQRLWGAVKPLCANALGNAEVAEKIGMNTCMHLILDIERKNDPEAQAEAMRQVAEMRAGMRPMPAENQPMHPVVKMMLAATGESKLFENEIAQSLGPEEAKRIVYHDELCMGHSTWGGPGPREPKK